MSYFTKNPSRFLKPKSVYLTAVKKPRKNVFKNELRPERTKVLNTCNSGAGGGQYVTQCKRITFRIHPTAPDSFHVREFLENELAAVATKYSTTSFYVTQSETRVPNITAHYLNGYHEEQRTDNAREDLVAQFVEKYCNYSGDIQKGTLNRQEPVEYSRSVQGMWNPYLNSPQANLTAPLSTQELKDKHRQKVDVDKFRGLAPNHHKDALEKDAKNLRR